MKRTPLIILNGFLGRKTTLLKNLLTQAHKRRMTVSVIVNDMSELDVDGVLIANTEIVDAASNNFVSISADSISSRSGIQKLDSALKTCSKNGLRILFYWKRQAAAILFPWSAICENTPR